jgi:hypothetical protein
MKDSGLCMGACAEATVLHWVVIHPGGDVPNATNACKRSVEIEYIIHSPFFREYVEGYINSTKELRKIVYIH